MYKTSKTFYIRFIFLIFVKTDNKNEVYDKRE